MWKPGTIQESANINTSMYIYIDISIFFIEIVSRSMQKPLGSLKRTETVPNCPLVSLKHIFNGGNIRSLYWTISFTEVVDLQMIYEPD